MIRKDKYINTDLSCCTKNNNCETKINFWIEEQCVFVWGVYQLLAIPHEGLSLEDSDHGLLHSREKMPCGLSSLDCGFSCLGEEEFPPRRGCGRSGPSCLGCGKQKRTGRLWKWIVRVLVLPSLAKFLRQNCEGRSEVIYRNFQKGVEELENSGARGERVGSTLPQALVLCW